MAFKKLWNGVCQIVFEGTEKQMENLDLAYGFSDNDLPRKVLKETRVYVVHTGKTEEGITDPDYLLELEFFQDEAERQGTVYTLDTFANEFNENSEISSNTHYIRIVDVELPIEELNKENKFYYEIHVTGKNGFSTSLVSDVELDDDDVIMEAYKAGKLEDDDCHHVDYVNELTFEEWNENFNFNPIK